MSTVTRDESAGYAASVAVHVLIAVKSLADAKTRLARDFAADDRRQLVLAMFRDTVTAARAAEAVASVTVVTPDDAVAAAAQDLDAAVVPEPTDSTGVDTGNARLNRALAHAAAHLRRDGSADLVALQADLPALTAAELSHAIGAAPGKARSFVADHETVGTAALLVRGDGIDLAPRFGHDSARRHLDSGAVALTGDWPGLRLDVDTPGDLEDAYRLGVGPNTRASLELFGWTIGVGPQKFTEESMRPTISRSGCKG